MKKIKRLLCLIITLSLIASVISGCDSPAENSTTEASADVTGETSDDASPSASDSTPNMTYDYETASKFYDPDELMITVNGSEVYWQEYYYWLNTTLSNYIEYYYRTTSFDSEINSLLNPGTTLTTAEALKEMADYYCVDYRLIEQYAEELGVEITEEDMAKYEEDLMANYDSEEALQAELDASYLSKDNVLYMNKINDMYTQVFDILYGENAINLPDEEVAAFAEENGYYQSKHILFSTVDEEGNDLSEDVRAAKKAEAEEVVELLEDYSGDDLPGYFQELIDEYNEDPGLSSNPDGYLCNSGKMVLEFEEAANALGDNEISGLVETNYGYHIIMRVPINYDSIPTNDSYGYTLRYYAGSEAFNNTIKERKETADIKYSDAYEAMDFTKMFPLIEVEKEVTNDAAIMDPDTSDTDTSDTDTSE